MAGDTSTKRRRSSGDHGLGERRLSDDGGVAQLGKDDTMNTMTRSNLTGDDHSGGSDKKRGGAARLNDSEALRWFPRDKKVRIV